MQTKQFKFQLQGTRPIMFDRYPGDNNTQLQVMEKFYTDQDGNVVLPTLNLMSLLGSENKSVPKTFYGKAGRDIAFGVNSFVNIEEMEMPITFSGKKIKAQVGPHVKIMSHVARIKKANLMIPSPKTRPVIDAGWEVEFTVNYNENKYCSETLLADLVRRGGDLGLGTFRPIFGKYKVVDVKEL